MAVSQAVHHTVHPSPSYLRGLNRAASLPGFSNGAMAGPSAPASASQSAVPWSN